MTAATVLVATPAPPARRLLSVDETAQALGVCSRHLRTLIVRGQVRSVRLGRRVLVPREEIDRLATAGAS